MAYKFCFMRSQYPAGLQAHLSRTTFGNGACIERRIPIDSFKLNGSTQLGNGGNGPAHGQAALILVETLMHALLEKGVISQQDFIETVEGAAEVEQELNAANASSPSNFSGSLLLPLATAFRREFGT